MTEHERERLVQPDPEVLEGDDELPRQPVSDRDPFVPEPYARPGERRAWRLMRLAAIVLVVLALVIVVYALAR
jgi:hypothetical protein